MSDYYVFNPRALKLACEFRGMTQTKLGGILGVGQSTVSKYFNGSITPNERDIQALAECLHVLPLFFYLETKRRKTVPSSVFNHE
jgi:transcriptional regulator with XRE-family HTH domain